MSKAFNTYASILYLGLVGAASAFGGACYLSPNENPPPSCSPIGAGCGGIGGAPALGCPGTFVVGRGGVNIGWPCDFNALPYQVPRDNAVGQDLATGYMEMGNEWWVCYGNETCTKNILPTVPVTVVCTSTVTPCSQTLRFTSKGAQCTNGSPQGGTQPAWEPEQ